MSNMPPKKGMRVPSEEMHTLVVRLFEKAGTSHEDAELMAGLLVANDLRGVLSHGSRQTATYVRNMLDGKVNPRPRVTVVSETKTTRVIDGDGGLGHFPCSQGAAWAVERAREYGTAAVTTRNHHHFGSAGKYSRVGLEHDCIGMAISTHRYALSPDRPIMNAITGSPMSLAVPAGEQPPLVLDMGVRFLNWDAEIFDRHPFAYFKMLGLTAVTRALAGILPGIYREEFQPPKSRWESNQGSFIAMFDVRCFMPIEEFKQEMDRYIGDARRMQPFPGYDRAELPGGMEWNWEQVNAREGIPVSPENQKALEEIAARVGVETPFARYEQTRFEE